MTHDNTLLREIASVITDDRRPLHSLGAETGALHDLLRERATFHIDPDRDITEGETRCDSGLAISPTQAAMCAREVNRTAAFIRGTAHAIRDVNGASRDRPVRVLYAGCGPYAVLAVPQMSLFAPEQVQFVLLDIHEHSIQSAKGIVESLGFTRHVTGYVCEDACHYEIPRDEQPDIIISETMNVCLASEPLVAIACHLLNQSERAILLPSQVRVDACLVDDAREFIFVEPAEFGEDPLPHRDRMMLGAVFELNAENAGQWASTPGDQLPASRIMIPAPLERRYRPALFTTINVYGTTVLKDYDCSLTMPRPLPVSQRLRGGDVLQFHYRLGNNPGLACEVVQQDQNETDRTAKDCG